MLRKNHNISDNFLSYKDEKSALKSLDIKKDNIDLIKTSLDSKNCLKNILLGYIF